MSKIPGAKELREQAKALYERNKVLRLLSQRLMERAARVRSMAILARLRFLHVRVAIAEARARRAVQHLE